MGVKVMKINRLPKGNPGFITPKGVLWCRMAQEGDGRDKRTEGGGIFAESNFRRLKFAGDKEAGDEGTRKELPSSSTRNLKPRQLTKLSSMRNFY